MSSSAREKNNFHSVKAQFDTVLSPHCNGQKVRFENEEAEIVRTSPCLVIKTKDRVVCGALYHRIQYLAV